MRPPAAVIFDCDGVLVDSERLEPGTIAEALTWIDGAAHIDAVELHGRHRGGVLAAILAEVELGTGSTLPDWFLPRYRELQLRRLGAVEPVPGATEAVAAVVAAGLPRCVVSGGPMAKMEVSLRATGLWDSFAPHIFSCYDIGDHKPSPGIYLHALDRMAWPADEVTAIEDSVHGVTAAAAAGVRVIGLARDTTPDALLTAGAWETVPTMSAALALILP